MAKVVNFSTPHHGCSGCYTDAPNRARLTTSYRQQDDTELSYAILGHTQENTGAKSG